MNGEQALGQRRVVEIGQQSASSPVRDCGRADGDKCSEDWMKSEIHQILFRCERVPAIWLDT